MKVIEDATKGWSLITYCLTCGSKIELDANDLRDYEEDSGDEYAAPWSRAKWTCCVCGLEQYVRGKELPTFLVEQLKRIEKRK